MVKFVNSKFIPLYFIVLWISYVFYCFYFLCISLFLWFFFCNVILIRNCANGQKDRINTVLVHFKKISNFHVFCTQTYAKCIFLGKFCADMRVQNVMWPRDRWSDFRKLGTKRCVRLERKKSWKGVSRSAAVARQSRISYRGGQIDPPPPQLR